MNETPSPEFQLAQEVFAGQPFTALVEAHLLRFEPGVAAIEVPHRPQLLQQHGFLHGGRIERNRTAIGIGHFGVKQLARG